MEIDSVKAFAKQGAENNSPVGGFLNSLCQLCQQQLQESNSKRYCKCRIYSHRKCLIKFLSQSHQEQVFKCNTSFWESHPTFTCPKLTIGFLILVILWFSLGIIEAAVLIDMIADQIHENSIWQSDSIVTACLFTPFFIVITLFILRRQFLKQIVLITQLYSIQEFPVFYKQKDLFKKNILQSPRK